ncbi:hypothetical protein LGI69_001460 [Salmonella enterica]|uniref:Uncharacterized protein n=1 Tax=Salmonella enterica subsp. diarizonae serovar 48:i:z TaxID=1192842 RepID=A0A735RD01_SALDZ|nr:hypothetical protein [Salmonella enterica]EBP3539153.1 hypothetical protein [Salmonella enterica subsp. enterica]EDJ9246581.1 hypothetical protein [Salmonella enterica subsp. diarizonae]EAR7912157.1 hypothetical protein [Salmonella enterica]EAT4548852.1 hypothetical protein [Salmonella enterica]EAT6177366.1 hypothetical protein [Salmonella enterica]
MKKLTLAVAAATLAMATTAYANPTYNAEGSAGTTGEVTSSTSFVYTANANTSTPIYTTNIVTGNEAVAHGVLADTTFVVPDGVQSAKLAATYSGANSSALEATFAGNTNSVATVKTGVKTLSKGDGLHILLQNTSGSSLNAGATIVTYNVTTYTD